MRIFGEHKELARNQQIVLIRAKGLPTLNLRQRNALFTWKPKPIRGRGRDLGRSLVTLSVLLLWTSLLAVPVTLIVHVARRMQRNR